MESTNEEVNGEYSDEIRMTGEVHVLYYSVTGEVNYMHGNKPLAMLILMFSLKANLLLYRKVHPCH